MASTMPSRPGQLFVVATPIGNLEDLSPRALRVLRQVALLACEDTRRTATLLRANAIQAPLTSLFEHNERLKTARILEALRGGQDVALVSDAGTPAISDPGFHLIREAHAAGLPGVPIPGPGAVMAALSASGLPSDRFLFVGFLPARAGARRRALEELRERTETLVLYESPVRVLASVADMLDVWGDREAFLAREATKVHEELRRGRLSVIQAALAERDAVRGEITLVVGGAEKAPGLGLEQAGERFRQLVSEGRARRAAVKEIARMTGRPAREIYQLVLQEEPERDEG